MVNAASTVHGAQKPALPDQSGGRPRDRDILSAREAQFRYVWDWYAKTGLDYGDRKNGNATRRLQRQWACWMHISMGEPYASTSGLCLERARKLAVTPSYPLSICE